MKTCVIDIGTNSIHAIFAEIRSTGVFQVIGKGKEMVRLGDGSLVTGMLSEAAMTTSLEVLKRFAHLAKHRGVARVMVTATSAVRESLNGGEFLDRVRNETDLAARIITGREEGRLIALAVRNTIDYGGRKALVVDIGGGSAEFALCDQKQTYWVESLRLGANRLRQIFPFSDPPKKSEMNQLEEYLQAALAPIFKKLKETPADFVIGTSGTINALARILLPQESPGGQMSLRQSTLAAKQLEAQYAQLAEMKLSDRQKIRGLDKDRADMIVHGAAVLHWLLKGSGISSFTACDKALREGVLYEFIEKNRKSLKIEEDIPDIRRRSVIALANLYEPLRAHAGHTAELAVKLFDACSAFAKVGDAQDRELLEYAAYIHDVGYLISFNKHHKHAYYLVTNTEMPGFSAEEILIIAWIARLHRRSVSKKDEDFAKLNPDTQKRILRMASLLRIADALDHSHFALVQDVKIKEDGGVLKIRLQASADAQWEVYEAMQRKDLFEKTFGKKLEFKIRVKNDDSVQQKS